MRLFAVVLVSLPLAILPCPASAARAADPVALVRRGLSGWNETTSSIRSSPSSVRPEPGSSTPSDLGRILPSSSSPTSVVVGSEPAVKTNSFSDTRRTTSGEASELSEDPTHQIRTVVVPPEAKATDYHDHSTTTSAPAFGRPLSRAVSSFQHTYLNTTTKAEQIAPSPSDSSSPVSFLHLPDPAASLVTSLSQVTGLSAPPSPPSLVFLTLNRTSTATLDLNDTHGHPAIKTDECSSPENFFRPTTYSIIYTATTTFFGDPADYTPPFAEITTPVACVSPTTTPELFATEAPGFGDGDNEVPGFGEPELTTFCFTGPAGVGCATDIVQAPGAISVPPDVKVPGTVTFITTDKNPSVVFSPVSTPNYGKHTTKNPHLGDHHSVDGSKPQRPDPHRPSGPKDLPFTNKQLPTTTFKITLEPTRVVIEDQTFSLLPTQTTRVTVSDETFTINPTQVIGGGSTIDRPWNGGEGGGTGPGRHEDTGSGGAEPVRHGGSTGAATGHGPNGGQGGDGVSGGQGVTIAPTTTTIGNVPVVIAPAGTQPVVVVDGTTHLVPTQGSIVTFVVQGTVITIAPTAIIFPSETIPIGFPNAKPVETEHVVLGGRMITAIGSTVVVIHETTITYGPGISARTETVDGGLVTVGPSGVVIDEKTIGGPKAGSTKTAYEIVGGVTITQIGASVVVIEGSTWTVGPEAKSTHTTEVRGETIIIAPEGVSIETLSFTYPFGPTVVTTIRATPSVTLTNPSASQTQDTKNNGVANGGSPNSDDDEGSGAGLRGMLGGAFFNMGFCIILGVWHIMGYML